MNLLLKVLTAIALVAIILAAGSMFLKSMERRDDRDDKATPARIVAGGDSETMEAHRPGPPEAPPDSAADKSLTGPIEIAKDDPLQPSYRPVNEPERIQMLRKEGMTYHNIVAGKLSGQASKKDWGFVGSVFFDYIYTIDSKGRILKNDGVKIVEERMFGLANESLVTSAYEIGIELPESLSALCSAVQVWGSSTGGPIGEVAETAGAIANSIQAKINHFRVPLSKSVVDSAREIGFFKNLPIADPATYEREIKMFTQGPDAMLLQGKTVRIEFVDGYGIRNIEPLGCSLTEQERDVIVRTNFIVDHYLFPDKKVGVDDEWTVDGSVFGGFMDPRLHGKVSGAIKVMRAADVTDARGKGSKKLRVIDGNVTISGIKAGSEVNGEVNSLRGVATISEETSVVTAAHFHGAAEYHQLSRDHLLFEARTSFTPRFEVQYECSVR